MEKFEKGKGKEKGNADGVDGACVTKGLTEITEYNRFLWLVLDIDIHFSNREIFKKNLISYCVHKEFLKTPYHIGVTWRDSDVTGLRRIKEKAFDLFTFEKDQPRFIFFFQNGYLDFPTFKEC